MRRRATTGVDGTRGLVFVFLWGLLRCRRGILSHALERPFGAVTPLERRAPALRRGRRGLMRSHPPAPRSITTMAAA